ncbi:hypothetical protein [Pontivivens nitratireducens]|uniref:Uncharacterized protein n=1 Tax=Pontivivens nitratireducens TaxID=2758038 RepID=A0A6G7VR38_9RHOB|nr:hypothetical protein [Pontibrevibacter nitratireducens]QIK42345.1 hypothetical protein G8E03_15990 [Pontibrevibacter nitratireducens]
MYNLVYQGVYFYLEAIMTLTLRAALAALALVLASVPASAQDDGRAFDVQIADQIAAACGSDSGACAAILATIPPNSPLHEQAMVAAISSGMSDAEVAQVAQAAKLSPAQAQRVQTVAAVQGRTSGAVSAAIAAATVGVTTTTTTTTTAGNTNTSNTTPSSDNDDDDDEDEGSPT